MRIWVTASTIGLQAPLGADRLGESPRARGKTSVEWPCTSTSAAQSCTKPSGKAAPALSESAVIPY